MSTPEEQMATMVAHLPEKTGKSLQEWNLVQGEIGRSRHGPKGLLETSGSFKAMVSRRVRVSDGSWVEENLIGWLKKECEEAS